MKREIKFRGRRAVNGEWVYGSLLSDERHSIAISHYMQWEVDAKTIGQFTGLKDKDGKDIYDGDICNCREHECYGKVAWNDDEAGFYFCISYEDGMFEEEQLYDYVSELKIIGNIHDNPELLEV